ncbi:MAG TPA: hypothetical protein VGV67_12315 [Solirubrobacteraceae bacterium]|nr:hypothetical protein [Solirubrobacteraceae bacterium]
MSAVAVDAAVAALPAGDGRVEVTGDGELAAALRSRLGSRAARGPDAPQAAIDTTGDVATIADTLARLADLGTLVLAGPPPAAPVALDLYADVHVRGLTIVGVAPTGAA